uniref:Rad21/Rec8-like protein N-terminal domain-containing protein n=1 Tax=Panagrolaimus sp. ES5 TaxID=591445 RepID=A0AC34F0A8_9BILA
MFDLPLSIRKKGTPYYIIWSYAFNPKKILKLTTREELLKFDIKKFCENFEESLPTPARAEKELLNRFSLYLTGHLLLGVTRVFDYRVTAILENAQRIIARINAPWDFLTVDEASPALSPIQQAQREMSPMDADFDPMEGPRADLFDDDFVDQRPNEDFQDEEPRRDEEQPAAGAAQPVDENEPPAAGRKTRKRAPKRPRPDTDDEDDDFGKKRKPRRKPAGRKGAVLNIARREDITMREDVLQESLEQDLLLDDLAPFEEEDFAIHGDQLIQLPNDTLLIIRGDPETAPRAQPDGDHDFDYQDFDVPARSASSSQCIAVKMFDNTAPRASPFHGAINLNGSRSQTPRPIARSRSSTPRPIAHSRLSTPQPKPDGVDHDFDYQDFDVRPRSVSPSRIIAVRLFDSPVPSAPPSTRSSPLFQGVINFDGSRSTTPRPQPDGDHDFDFADQQLDETAEKSFKKPRQKRMRRQHAREPVICFDAEELRTRDQVFLQKDIRNVKINKFRVRLDNYQDLYKVMLGGNVNIEANDDLRDLLDERIGRLDMERPRHRGTKSGELSSYRLESRLTELHSGRETPKEDQHEEQQQVPMSDPIDYDFDNDFRPLSPQPDEEAQQDQIPPKQRARTPIQYHDIEYVEPVPLPPGMEHLISPPRAVPLELFNSSSRAPFKELACKYDHDDLYMLILYRCAKEKKAVFKFSDFANHWPRAYIAKQYHNFLLLNQMGKILARNVHGVFHSFIVIPNEEFKTNMAKVLVRLNREAAA